MKRGIISFLLGGAVGGIAGASAVGKKLGKDVKGEHTYAQKHLMLMQMFNQWLIDKQEGKNLARFFEDKGYKSIAIYGMSYLGERLVDELKGSGIEVKYAIDKNADNIYADVEVKQPSDDLPEVDAVVVTAVYFFDEIESELAELVDCPVISLEDVLFEV